MQVVSPLAGVDFALSNAEFERLRELVREHTGIALSEAKRQLIYSRLARRLRALQLPGFSEYIQLLEQGDSKELEEFTNAVTTNLTSFFREPHHFEYLGNEMLPSLAKRNNGLRRLRIWCCAASTGEEPYSIAMVLREAGCTPDIVPNTDVIVIRRFNTEPTPVASVVSTQTYVQISECASGPSADNPATPYLVDTGSNAANFILRNRNCSAAANLWRYREQLYYVRNYSVNAGDGIPTLVRVELDGGVSNPVPLVEGIDNLRVDLGVDTDGDGAPDVWRRCDASTPCTAADYSNVMAAKVYVLSRTLDQSREYTDTKAYQLGVSGSTTATNDHYKRHVYSALIGMPNRSGPREPILAS